MSDLVVRGLTVTAGGVARVAGVDLDLARGARLGVVGPSGAGKTLLVRGLTGFVPATGRVALDGAEHAPTDPAWRALVARRLTVLWQDSARSLNPTRTVGRQLVDTLRLHHGAGRTADAVGWLDRVAVDRPGTVVRQYPHQLSGGTRQRIAVALALCGGQPVVVADEPTTGMDLLVQRACTDLLDRLCAEDGRSLLLVSHDLPLVAELCTDLLVLDGGAVVERGPCADVLAAPTAAVTQDLVARARRLHPGGPVC